MDRFCEICDGLYVQQLVQGHLYYCCEECDVQYEVRECTVLWQQTFSSQQEEEFVVSCTKSRNLQLPHVMYKCAECNAIQPHKVLRYQPSSTENLKHCVVCLNRNLDDMDEKQSS